MSSLKRLKFEDIQLGPVLFRPSGKDEGWENLPLELSVDVLYNEDEPNAIVCILHLAIGGFAQEKKEDEEVVYPFDLRISYAGFFTVETDDFSEENLKKIGGINCAAIIFPFLREEVANLVLKCFHRPFLLPPVNFVRLLSEKGVNLIKS